MGERGPKPSGSVKVSARLSAGLVKDLKAAAVKRGKSVSQEIENRLNRTFPDDHDERTRALMRLLQSVLRSTMGRKTTAAPRPNIHWLDDPHTFDQAVIAIDTVLAAIRPPGAIEAPAGGGFRGRFNTLVTLQDIQKAPAIAPANASRHLREMAHIRQGIGDVVDRAIVFGKTAGQIRAAEPERMELMALRRKEAAAGRKPPGPPLTNEERRRMQALIKRLIIRPAEDEPIAFSFEPG